MLNIRHSLIAISVFSFLNLSCQNDDDKQSGTTDLCSLDLANDCLVLEDNIAVNEAELRTHLENSDFPAAVASAYEIEHRKSLRELYRLGLGNDSQSVQDELKRYQDMIDLTLPVAEDGVQLAFDCSESAACEKHAAQYDRLARRYDNTPNKKSSAAVKNLIEMNKERRHLSLSLEGSEDTSLVFERAYAALQGILASLERYKIGESLPLTLSPTPSMCDAAVRSKCDELGLSISQYRQMKEDAFTSGQWELVNYAVLMMNYHTDLLNAYISGALEGDQQLADLHTRIANLKMVSNYGLPSYSLEEQNEVDKVTNLYGSLAIGLSETDEEGKLEWSGTELEGRKPWSGYWYPMRYGDMFEGRVYGSFKPDQSPLEQFDRLLEALGRTPGAAAWERDRKESSVWESGDGLCDAWAVAAALHKEPNRSVEVNGVSFESTHAKALLVQMYTNYSKDMIGRSYEGGLDTDGLGQDLRPEAFHLLITNMLANQKTPIVDTDPNFPIWNMPMYRYDWRVEKDTTRSNAFVVTARPWYVKFRNAELSGKTDYSVGRTGNLFLPTYKYRLYFAEGDQAAEKKIIYGEWIMDDVAQSHPDTVFKLNDEKEYSPRNPFIADNLDVLKELVGRF